mgnify:CR=1
MRRRLSLAVLFVGWFVASAAWATPIRFGISEFAEHSVNEPIIPATVALLEKTFGKDNVSAVTYSVAELQQAAKTGAVDIILSSAGTYRRLSLEGAGVHSLASVASARVSDPNYADGSVFFARNDREDIRSIEDLRGKTVAANHRWAFSGWQTAMGELLEHGIVPDGFFGEVHFKGHDMPQVVSAVVNGEADAGIVRACFLEDMGINPSAFRILGERPRDGKIDCVRSTDLYPNWTISTLPSLSPEASRHLAAALFSMPMIENGLRWSIANDFRPIDLLFYKLKIGPYEYLQHFSLKRFLLQNWPFIAMAFLVMLGLLLHSVTVSSLVRKRTAELVNALEHEKVLEAETAAAQNRFVRLQKVGVIGQMSSIIAHELRQPLGSIELYCYGLLRGLEDGTETPKTTAQSVERISAQTKRAAAIVDQVRAYAKGDRKRTPIELQATLTAAVAEAKKTTRASGVPIQYVAQETMPLWVTANPLEIELIVVNLVKNAVEALGRRKGGEVRVTLSTAGGYAVLSVADNGAVISDAAWTTVRQEYLTSEKSAGLGLGLSIVRSMTEDLGGELRFDRPATGGLTVEVRLKTVLKEA